MYNKIHITKAETEIKSDKIENNHNRHGEENEKRKVPLQREHKNKKKKAFNLLS